MDFQQQEGSQLNKRVLKKGAEINFFQKIYRYFGFLLPISFVLLLFLMLYVGYKYYDLSSKYKKFVEVNNSYNEALSNNQAFISLISNYGKTLEKYNEYTSSLINFPILFKTIEKYIPKDMQRASLKIDKNNRGDINISINGKIEGYNSYLSLLKLVDKCNFMSESEKNSFLSLNKIDLSPDGEKLGEEKSIALNFVFNMQKNKILGLNFYKTSLKKFDQYGNYLYLQDIISNNRQDIWNENLIDYKEPLKNLVEKKIKYSTELSKIAKIDLNGFYIGGTAGNFISEYKDQNKIFEFLIEDFQKQKEELNILLSDLFDDGIVKYKKKKDSKEQIISDLKIKLKKQIENIGQEISYLTLLQRYNNYLLSNNNGLNTIENLKRKNTKDFDKILANLIKNNKILEEGDIILEPFVGETKTNKEKQEKQKTAYVKLYNFIKDIDNRKKEFLDVKSKYIDTYYIRYYNNNNIKSFYEVIKGFIDNGYDENLFNNIVYKTFNFNAQNANANFSYKKRFYLTIKNDSNTRKYINFLSNENEFSKGLIEYEDFLKQEDDLITYNNSKINCLERDVKEEIKEIYKDVLSEETQKIENEKKIKELNIIINTLQ